MTSRGACSWLQAVANGQSAARRHRLGTSTAIRSDIGLKHISSFFLMRGMLPTLQAWQRAAHYKEYWNALKSAFFHVAFEVPLLCGRHTSYGGVAASCQRAWSAQCADAV